MGFNELNSVEHYIIHQLSGINLNSNSLAEKTPIYSSSQWVYKSTQELERGINEVLLESEVKKALIRLNPEIAKRNELADEVIYKLRAILISVNQVGLVRANEELFKWLTGDKTMPFGDNNRHVPVNLIDFKNLQNNTYPGLCTN